MVYFITTPSKKKQKERYNKINDYSAKRQSLLTPELLQWNSVQARWTYYLHSH
jgi:hypothetical protein